MRGAFLRKFIGFFVGQNMRAISFIIISFLAIAFWFKGKIMLFSIEMVKKHKVFNELHLSEKDKDEIAIKIVNDFNAYEELYNLAANGYDE